MGKTWSCGTNSRLPFGVNLNLNLSNNTKRSSSGEGKLPLKLAVIKIEPWPFFRTRSFRQSCM